MTRAEEVFENAQKHHKALKDAERELLAAIHAAERDGFDVDLRHTRKRTTDKGPLQYRTSNLQAALVWNWLTI